MYKESAWKHYILDNDKLPFFEVMIEEKDNTKSQLNIISNDGKISEDFIEKYAKYYYTGVDWDGPRHLNQTDKDVEDKVMEIKEKDNWTIEDVRIILAWKTGNIQQELDSESNLQFKGNWEKGKVQFFRRPEIDDKTFKEFADNVIRIRKEYKVSRNSIDTNNAIYELWTSLINANKVNGLGTVVLITLMSFITNGNMPIYDKYAMAALLFIDLMREHKIKVSEPPFKEKITITMKALPGKENNGKLSKILENGYYNYYISLLDRYFTLWKTDRTVDQALWVFGHYFDNVTQN